MKKQSVLVDWGTSALRLWILSDQGEVVAKRQSDKGMSTLTPGDYEGVLTGMLRDAGLADDAVVQVVICGMAGAKGGWQEAGYRQVPCPPVSAQDSIRVATTSPRLEVHILPGLCQRDPSDVMRGEETQLAGLMSRLQGASVTACLPGTHSKWVQIKDDRIERFSSVMTGDLFAAISTATILRLSIADDGMDDASYLKAVEEAFASPQKISSILFSIRAGAILDGADPVSARSRLSGLLIGVELAAMHDYWASTPVHLIGAETLSSLYAMALNHVGGTTVMEKGEALTLSGLRAGWEALV